METLQAAVLVVIIIMPILQLQVLLIQATARQVLAVALTMAQLAVLEL